MTVKEILTELLEKNKGKYLSGEQLAEKIGCTRGAVWKAVKSLQDSGYDIEAVTNRGYRLKADNDVISSEGIAKYLNNKNAVKTEVYRIIDSTNLKLKQLAAEGACEGTLVISGEQTAGRGRLGRTFYSPSDTGIYMSLLLRPALAASEAIKITTAAAAATADTLAEVSGKKTEIKWVNDIYIDGLKVCGILTEAAFDMEFGGLEYAVLGIGINVYEPSDGFPEEIKGIAGAVFEQKISDMRNRIAAGIINRFMEYYKALEQNTYFESYSSRLMWIGQDINIISPAELKPAVLEGVDENCRLIVRYEDGTKGLVSSGEISIRKRFS